MDLPPTFHELSTYEITLLSTYLQPLMHLHIKIKTTTLQLAYCCSVSRNICLAKTYVRNLYYIINYIINIIINIIIITINNFNIVIYFIYNRYIISYFVFKVNNYFNFFYTCDTWSL